MAKTSESKLAPSWRACTSVTTPAMVTDSPPSPGRSRVVTTTSSSCRYAPEETATQNFSGVASNVPSTPPTGSPSSILSSTLSSRGQHAPQHRQEGGPTFPRESRVRGENGALLFERAPYKRVVYRPGPVQTAGGRAVRSGGRI